MHHRASDFPRRYSKTALLGGRNAKGRRAYVLLSYGSDKRAQCATITAALACRQVAETAQYDVVLLRIGEPIDESILPRGIQQVSVEEPVTRGRYQWTSTFAKFYVATERFSKYASIVFVDADTLVRKPLTPLFEVAEVLPDTLVAPRAYWCKQPFAMSGTFALSRSSQDSPIHERMIHVLHHKDAEVDGDMDWFNTERVLSEDVSLLSGFFTLLVGEFSPRDPVYRFWGKRLHWSDDEVFERAYIIHFIANWKPWSKGIREANGVETRQLQQAYQEWTSLYQKTKCSANIPQWW